MKYSIMKYALSLLVLAASVGCKDDEGTFDNNLYIDQTQFVEEILVKAGVVDVSKSITLSIAQPIANDVKITMKAAPSLLEHYRQAYYDADAVLLDAAHYTVANGSVEIQAGSVTSTPVQVDFMNLSALNRDLRYVLPVEVSSVDGVSVLESAKRYFFVFKGAALINVVPEMTETYCSPTWTNSGAVSGLTSLTFEALIYPYQFGRLISSIMGIEGSFLVRVGDAGIPDNQIQLATSSGNVTSSSLQLTTGEWQHFAMTYDGTTIRFYLNGSEVYSQDKSMSSINLARSDFYLGRSYSDDRYLDGRLSEVRIWNRALTTAEIQAQDHFYFVDPASEGLVAYWKMDEGEGILVKDYTANQNHMTFNSMPKWVSVALPETN